MRSTIAAAAGVLLDLARVVAAGQAVVEAGALDVLPVGPDILPAAVAVVELPVERDWTTLPFVPIASWRRPQRAGRRRRVAYREPTA
jgi:hypothetical protein